MIETTGDALREVARRIDAEIRRIEAPVAPRVVRGEKAALVSGYRISREIVGDVLREVVEQGPVEPAPTIPLRDDLCPMCGMELHPGVVLDGHAECREEE